MFRGEDGTGTLTLKPDCSFTLRLRRDSADVVETTLVTTVSCPGVFSILPGGWVDDMTTSSTSEDAPPRPPLPGTTEVNKHGVRYTAVGRWFPTLGCICLDAWMGLQYGNPGFSFGLWMQINAGRIETKTKTGVFLPARLEKNRPARQFFKYPTLFFSGLIVQPISHWLVAVLNNGFLCYLWSHRHLLLLSKAN